jgi:hypothetical protein
MQMPAGALVTAVVPSVHWPPLAAMLANPIGVGIVLGSITGMVLGGEIAGVLAPGFAVGLLLVLLFVLLVHVRVGANPPFPVQWTLRFSCGVWEEVLPMHALNKKVAMIPGNRNFLKRINGLLMGLLMDTSLLKIARDCSMAREPKTVNAAYPLRSSVP